MSKLFSYPTFIFGSVNASFSISEHKPIEMDDANFSSFVQTADSHQNNHESQAQPGEPNLNVVPEKFAMFGNERVTSKNEYVTKMMNWNPLENTENSTELKLEHSGWAQFFRMGLKNTTVVWEAAWDPLQWNQPFGFSVKKLVAQSQQAGVQAASVYP